MVSTFNGKTVGVELVLEDINKVLLLVVVRVLGADVLGVRWCLKLIYEIMS